MTPFLQLLAVLAAIPLDPAAPETAAVQDSAWNAALDPAEPESAPGPFAETPLDALAAGLAEALADDGWDQMRIEQRMVIRVIPRSSAVPAEPAAPQVIRLKERRSTNCLPVLGLGGVKVVSDSRLLVFMRDRRMMGLTLDKSCNARDFYSGFYVTQTSDGMICVKRDEIHSRSGANCTIGSIKQLELER